MMRRFFLAVTLLAAFAGAARAEWHEREAAIMGTRITVEVWHDALMSHYKPDSQLSRVNRDAASRSSQRAGAGLGLPGVSATSNMHYEEMETRGVNLLTGLHNDARIFFNNCVGCNVVMDPMAQACAYYTFDEAHGRLVYTAGSV
jgi:hypothetical protein